MSEMEAELRPYKFMETEYNKESFCLTNDETTASYIGTSDFAYLSTTRPIGRDHRLILNILGIEDVLIHFTKCDTLLTNSKHLMDRCGLRRCNGQNVTALKEMKAASVVSIRRTEINEIEAVVSDDRGGSSIEHYGIGVTADEPVVPVILVRKRWEEIQILPDEAGLWSVRSQIALRTHASDAVTTDGSDSADLKSLVQTLERKHDQQFQLQLHLFDQLTQKVHLLPKQVSKERKPKSWLDLAGETVTAAIEFASGLNR